MFARDFFEYLGYTVLQGPDRGADGGRDILLGEKRAGVGGETSVKWLVSCKHKAFSGGSVTPNDESDIRDRIECFKCKGFIGFYSTIPSSGLAGKLLPEKLKAEVQVFDREKIEKSLLGSPDGVELAKRYFPKSIEKRLLENPQPSKIFSEDEDTELKCDNCGKNLLDPEPNGIVVYWRHIPTNYKIEWEDIPDVIIPTVYVMRIMAVINQLRSGVIFSDSAFENQKQFFIAVFPHVSRHLTSREKERLKSLMSIPACVGGMGD